MDTTKRFRKILAAGAFAAAALITAPAVSGAALPGPHDLTLDPCSVITHGCDSTPPQDETGPNPTGEDEPDAGPSGGPAFPGPDDLTSATTVPEPTDHPTEDPAGNQAGSGTDAASGAVVVTPRYNG